MHGVVLDHLAEEAHHLGDVVQEQVHGELLEDVLDVALDRLHGAREVALDRRDGVHDVVLEDVLDVALDRLACVGPKDLDFALDRG